MSSPYWQCEECDHILSGMSYPDRCPKCGSQRLFFDSEEKPSENVEIWPVEKDLALIVTVPEESEDDDDQGPTSH